MTDPQSYPPFATPLTIKALRTILSVPVKVGDEVYFWRDNYGRVGTELVVELKSDAVKI